MIDWTKPIEAVRKADGKVVQMVFDTAIRGTHYTEEAPDSNETNCAWNMDGTDCCMQKKWYIRNSVAALPAGWAYKEAISRCGHDIGLIPNTAINELARMIEKHEQPPIDPDEQLARDTARKHSFAADGQAYEAILDAIKQVRANAL